MMTAQIEQLSFQCWEAQMLSPLEGIALSEIDTLIASLLLNTSAREPRTNKNIRQYLENQGYRVVDRELKRAIRRLRNEHAFPILASLEKPYGYWWCGSAVEMEGYISVVRSRALAELVCLKRIVDANFPQLSGQLSLPFDTEVNDGSKEV
jgi:hypothetical protein